MSTRWSATGSPCTRAGPPSSGTSRTSPGSTVSAARRATSVRSSSSAPERASRAIDGKSSEAALRACDVVPKEKADGCGGEPRPAEPALKEQ